MEEDYLPAEEEEDSKPTIILFPATRCTPRTSAQRLVKHAEGTRRRRARTISRPLAK
jgi:hypothetical protein